MTSSTAAPAVTRGPLARTGVAAAVVSGLCLALLLIGRLAGWDGFRDDNTNTALSAVTFLLFLAGFLVTVGVAVALVIRRQRRAALPLWGYAAAAVELSVMEGMGVFGR